MAKKKAFITDRSGIGSATSKKVIPTQTVKGSKPFGTYDFPRRGGK